MSLSLPTVPLACCSGCSALFIKSVASGLDSLILKSLSDAVIFVLHKDAAQRSLGVLRLAHKGIVKEKEETHYRVPIRFTTIAAIASLGLLAFVAATCSLVALDSASQAACA